MVEQQAIGEAAQNVYVQLSGMWSVRGPSPVKPSAQSPRIKEATMSPMPRPTPPDAISSGGLASLYVFVL